MNEIEKLYENAGVSKEVIPCPAKYYGYDCTRNNWDDADCSCDIEGYPQFTAEKQLELIKLLSSNSVGFGTCIEECCRKENFEKALAERINHLWQDLTSEEKEEIREILNK